MKISTDETTFSASGYPFRTTTASWYLKRTIDPVLTLSETVYDYGDYPLLSRNLTVASGLVVNGVLKCETLLTNDDPTYKSKIIGDFVEGIGAGVSILTSNNGGTSWSNIMTCSTSRVQILLILM